MVTPMTSRQRLQTVLARDIPDRIPLVDISFWPEILERWYQEGLPADMPPGDYFSLDRIVSFTFDGSLGLPAEVVEENDQWPSMTASSVSMPGHTPASSGIRRMRTP